MKMEQTECSETSAYKIQTSGSYPEESIKLKRCQQKIHATAHYSRFSACTFSVFMVIIISMIMLHKVLMCFVLLQ